MTISHLQDNLATLERETTALIRTAARLDDRDVRAASRCVGWTRAHVLTHIARNADGMTNLAHWATTGERTPQYVSQESRNADIEAGALRGAHELVEDIEDSATAFAVAARDLAGAPEDAEVEGRGGRPMKGRDVVTARLREVVFHHVDLDAGYTFADTDPGVVERALRESVRRMERADPPPSLTVRANDGGEWTIGGGDQQVSGTKADLLLWLSRGVTDGISSPGPLPELPSWG